MRYAVVVVVALLLLWGWAGVAAHAQVGTETPLSGQALLDAVSRDLESPQPEVRQAALKTLFRRAVAAQRPQVLALVYKALADSDAKVRRQAFGYLRGARSLPEGAQRIIKMLTDEDEEITQGSVDALGDVKPITSEMAQAIVGQLTELGRRTLRPGAKKLPQGLQSLRDALFTQQPDAARSEILRQAATLSAAERRAMLWWLRDDTKAASREIRVVLLQLETHESDAEVRAEIGKVWRSVSYERDLKRDRQVQTILKSVFEDPTATADARQHARELFGRINGSYVDVPWVMEQVNRGHAEEFYGVVCNVFEEIQTVQFIVMIEELRKATPETRSFLAERMKDSLKIHPELGWQMLQDADPKVRVFGIGLSYEPELPASVAGPALTELMRNRDPAIAEAAMRSAPAYARGPGVLDELRAQTGRRSPLRAAALNALAGAMEKGTYMEAARGEREGLARDGLYDEDGRVREASLRIWHHLHPGEDPPPEPPPSGREAMIAAWVVMTLAGAGVAVWGLFAGGVKLADRDADAVRSGLKASRCAWGAAILLLAACVIVAGGGVVMARANGGQAVFVALVAAVVILITGGPWVGALAVWGWRVRSGGGLARVVCMVLASLMLLAVLLALAIDVSDLVQSVRAGVIPNHRGLVFLCIVELAMSVICGLMLKELILWRAVAKERGPMERAVPEWAPSRQKSQEIERALAALGEAQPEEDAGERGDGQDKH